MYGVFSEKWLRVGLGLVIGLLGSSGWAARVDVGGSGFFLETPENIVIKETKRFKDNESEGMLFDGTVYAGNNKNGLQIVIAEIKSPTNIIAGTKIAFVTNNYYRGILNGLLGKNNKIRFDTYSIISKREIDLYSYSLIIDKLESEYVTRAVISTKKDITVIVLLTTSINDAASNRGDITTISDSLNWKD